MIKVAEQKFSSVKELVSITSQSVSYGVGILGRQVLIYLALPLFTRYMPPAIFGAISVMTAFMSFIDVLSNAGLPAGTFRIYNDTDDPAMQRQVLGTSLSLFGSFALVLAVLSIAFSVPLSWWLFAGSSGNAQVIPLVAILMLVMTFVNFGYLVLRLRVQPKVFSVHSIALTVTQVGLSLLFVIVYRLGIWGYWLGQLAGAIVGLVIMIFLTRKDWHPNIAPRILVDLLSFALPLIPATLAQWALFLVDRLIISHLIGLGPVGVYEIASTIATLSSVFMIPFSAAWPQFAYMVAKRPNAVTVYKDILSYCLLGGIIPALGIFMLSGELLHLFAPSSYNSALSIIPWLLLAQIIWGLYPVLVIGLQIKKKTSLITVTMLATVTLHVILLFWLIPVLGIKGAAISGLISYLFLGILTHIVSQRFYPIPVDWQRFIKIFIAAAIPIVMIAILPSTSIASWISILIRVLDILLFILILMVLEFSNIRLTYHTFKSSA